MSGQKVIILMFAGVLAIAAVTFALYLATRQLEDEGPSGGKPGAAAEVGETLTPPEGHGGGARLPDQGIQARPRTSLPRTASPASSGEASVRPASLFSPLQGRKTWGCSLKARQAVR